ncbi:hypothetical protein [Campylobacter devanensis]|uniref:hypothetical protein n=1 Tax=Campylobacter devanensis TaxID=3161138 RepID=UPI000A32FA11|nr:hypothetical protein [Campylobacter sp. P0227]
MKEIYSLIDNFDIWSALELCQEKHPVYYQNMLFECGLLNELVSYLHNSNLKHQFEKENMEVVDYNILKNLIKSKISSITNNNIFSKIPKEIIEFYIINYKINNKILSIDEAIKFLDNIRINFDKYSRNSIIFIFVEMFEYFESLNEWNYFARARSNINHILKVRFVNNIGSQIYYKKFSQIYNSYCSKDIKVAIMIVGAFRGHYKHCLRAAMNLAEYINADIFISSWDKVFCYPGLGGAGGNYVDRNFASIKNNCPDFINNKAKLRQHFPNVFAVLNQEYNESLNKNQFLKYNSIIKDAILENDEDFQRDIVDRYINKIKNITKDQLDNHFDVYFTNVCKQFYLLDKCCQIIRNYEKKHHFKYDYIIRIRPDSIPKLLHASELLKVKSNEIALNWMGQVEVDDRFMYGRRDEMLKFFSIYDFNKRQNFSYFLNIANMGWVHGMLSNWVMLNNLSPVSMRLQAPVEIKYHISYLPNFDQELQSDIKKSKLNEEQIRICIAFFDQMKNLIDQNNIYMEQQNDIGNNNAQFRIKNQLSYKLGHAMIENSKSIWGYIRMPFILANIRKEHKKEQIAYNEKIKANPSLKLPPLESYPDYKEALKEKECLTYKLGEAMIEASKNWYKGGYIKLFFDIKKIKREKMIK